MQNDIVFKVKRWGNEVYRSSQTYGHIRAFFSDNKVLEGYLDSHKPLKMVKLVTGSDGSISMLFEDGSMAQMSDDEFEQTPHTVSLSQDDITANLQQAEQFYNRQMVVVVATYIELILKDFLQVGFCKFPERMHHYLDDGNGYKGLVSLKLVTKAASLPGLISDLSEQAASNALKGRFKAQLNNLARIIPEQEISQRLQGQLIDIVEKRNRIVHEASQEQISEDNVREVLDTCFELLTSLADIAVKCNISLDISKDDEGF
jgi:hypothetical protein